jgi:hypothetical protein
MASLHELRGRDLVCFSSPYRILQAKLAPSNTFAEGLRHIYTENGFVFARRNAPRGFAKRKPHWLRRVLTPLRS